MMHGVLQKRSMRLIRSSSCDEWVVVVVQYSDKMGGLGSNIPRPGSLWPRGRVHAT